MSIKNLKDDKITKSDKLLLRSAAKHLTKEKKSSFILPGLYGNEIIFQEKTQEHLQQRQSLSHFIQFARKSKL